jgi:hypothetical protein
MTRPKIRDYEPVQFTAWLKPGTVDALRQVAEQRGYVVTTGGPYHGQGSITKMLEAIAQEVTHDALP